MTTTRLAYGCMRIAGGWKPDAVTDAHRRTGREAVLAAWEAGYRLFDHADIYCHGECETLFGTVLAEVPEMRKAIVLATKCGIRFPAGPGEPKRFDFSADYIRTSCEGSLRRLGVETIDLYQLHRPDVLMDPAEVAEAFDGLHRAGKVRWFGVSNFTPSQVALLQSGLDAPLLVNQIEIHPGRLDPFVDGTLDQCLREGLTPLAWSPLGKGLFAGGGTVRKDHPRREKLEGLVKTLDETAATLNSTRAAVTLAWLMRHPSGIVPIVGSTNPDHIRAATEADALEMTREQWYTIFIAARGSELP